jgi:RHS repeat-associated protein
MFVSRTKIIADYWNGAAASDPIREHFWERGNTVATHNIQNGNIVDFRHTDHLGSPRLTTDSSGNVQGYQGTYPFGEEWYSVSRASRFKFTGYERDSESGNDYAIFRTYAPRLGRFSSPDPLHGSLADPQSLNRFAYVRNDPINFIDPLGLHECQPGEDHVIITTFDSEGNITGQTHGCNPPPAPGGGGGEGGTVVGSGAGGCFLVITQLGWLKRICPPKYSRPFGSEAPNPKEARWRELLERTLRVPWSVTAILPLVVAGPLASGGAAGTAAIVPTGSLKDWRNWTGCLGGGVGLSAPAGGRSVSGGPLMHGNLDKAPQILVGGSAGAGVQLTPGIGYGIVTNSAGTLGGPTVGTPGVSVTATASACSTLGKVVDSIKGWLE